MANPIYNMLGRQQGNNAMLRQFEQFKRSFSGDPRQQIQNMLNSGRITQDDYNRAVQMAKSMMQMLK